MFTLAFMTWLGYASAEEFTVADVSIPKGGTAILEVNLNNPSTPCVGYQFVLSLPQGVSIAKRENETFIFNEGTRMSDLGFTTQIRLNEDSYNVLSYNANVIPMTGTTGAVVEFSSSSVRFSSTIIWNEISSFSSMLSFSALVILQV